MKKRSSNRISILDGTKIRRITPADWEEIVPEDVDSIPAHIDGLCAYAVDGLEGTKDERKWQKDSSTKWAGYSSVRYRNCNGSFSCQNPLCLFYIQYSKQNNVHFDKKGICNICYTKRKYISCDARKYVAKCDERYLVFHIGVHKCFSKSTAKRPILQVSQAIAQDPLIRPCRIQSNMILAALRNREPWYVVLEKVSSVVDEKSISNEKIKQCIRFRSSGSNFDAVRQLKSYTDKRDELLVYNVDEINGTVFKTSTEK